MEFGSGYLQASMKTNKNVPLLHDFSRLVDSVFIFPCCLWATTSAVPERGRPQARKTIFPQKNQQASEQFMELSKFKPTAESSSSLPSASAPKTLATVELHFQHLTKPSKFETAGGKINYCSFFYFPNWWGRPLAKLLEEGSCIGFCFWRCCLSCDSFHFLYQWVKESRKASSREQPVVPNQGQALRTTGGRTAQYVLRPELRCKICLFTITAHKSN